MPYLKLVPRATLSERVAVQVIDTISAERWKPGQKLPSEAELCQSLGVGRSTLREALKTLAFLGIVRTRTGDGTYVAENAGKLLGRLLGHGLLKTDKDVNDLGEVRMCLETEAVALCAERATDEDLQKLQHLLYKQQQCLEQGGENFLQWDLEMHLAVASSSRNLILAQLLETIRDLLEEYISKSQQHPGALELAYSQHSKILRALQQHDPRRARVAMQDHLGTFQRGYAILREASESGSGALEEEKMTSSSSQ